MKLKPRVEFFVPDNRPRNVYVKVFLGFSFLAVVCKSEGQARVISHLLNKLLRAEIYQGLVATEPERGGQE
jgi:hypothetical protein